MKAIHGRESDPLCPVTAGSRKMFEIFRNTLRNKLLALRFVRVWTLIVLCLMGGLWAATGLRGRDPQSLQDAARTALADDDFSAVRACIDELRRLPDYAAEVRILQASLNLRIGLPDAAVRELQPVVADRIHGTAALTLLGEAYHRLGRHLEAEQALRQSLSVNPSQTEARRWLAASYYDLGAMDLALEQLAILSREAPEDPRPNRLSGLIQKDFEQYQAAIEDYTESLRRGPDEVSRQEIVVELAECQVKQHLYEDASETLSLATSSADTLLLQARCAQALNEPGKAASLVERALAIEPTHLEARLFQAEILLDAGSVNEAAGVLEKTVAAWPGDYRPRYQLANIYRRLGMVNDAELQSAEVQRLQKLSDEFTELHQRAFSDTTNAALRFRLGEIADQLQKRELAEVWYRAALGIDPAHAAARSALKRQK